MSDERATIRIFSKTKTADRPTLKTKTSKISTTMITERNFTKAALLSAAFLCVPFFASALTSTFTGTVSGGPFDGVTGSGNFTYDNTAITDGTGVVVGSDLGIEFTLFGQMFDESDDINFIGSLFSATPVLTVLEGMPIDLDFAVSEDPLAGLNTVAIDQSGVTGFSFISGSLMETDVSNHFSLDIDVVVGDLSPPPSRSVPDNASTSLLLLSSVLGLVSLRKRLMK